MQNTNIVTKKRFMLGIYDKIFKAILINKDNIDYLRYLIHYITKIPLKALKNIKIENTLHPVKNKNDKQMESDILVSVDNKIINIEMDKDYYDGVFEKGNAYLHDYASRQYNESDNYKNSKQIIQIIFQNFDYFKMNQNMYEFKYIDEKTGLVLENEPIKYYIPLSFIKKKCYNNNEFTSGSAFEKYCLLLEEDDENQLNKIIGDDEILKRVKKNIEKLNEDKDLVIWYDAKQREEMEFRGRLEYAEKIASERGESLGKKIGEKLGEKRGIEKGRTEEKICLTKKMLENGISIQDVSSSVRA